MSDSPQVKRDADELQTELLRNINGSEITTVSASAYIQAVFAQQAAQALLILLVHKNVFSDSELQKALGDAYHAAAHRLKNASDAIIVPPPMPRPNGGF